MERLEYKVGDIVVIKKNPHGFKKFTVTEITTNALTIKLESSKTFYSIRNPNGNPSLWQYLSEDYILCKANKREQFLYYIYGVYQSTDRIKSKQLAYKWKSVRGRMLDET